MSTRLRAVPGAAKALVVLLFGALFWFGIQAPIARAATEPPLDLTVTAKTGGALSGLTVWAYPVENHTVVDDGIQGVAIGNGVYRFRSELGNGLDSAREYTFYFDAPGTTTVAFDQFYGGTTWVEEAKTWSSTEGTTLHVTLATNSTITGKVTGLSSRLLAGVTVIPYRFDGNGWFRLSTAAAVTSSLGVYAMRNLEPGTYRLEFSIPNTTGYLSEYSGNSYDFDTAAAVNVGLGATVAANAGLVAGGSISGRVKLQRGATFPDPWGITAYAYPVLPGGAIDTSRVYVSKPTAKNSGGAWVVNGLPAGSYKVKLYDTTSFAFIDVWADDADGTASVVDAKAYPVTVGRTTVTPVADLLVYFEDVPDTNVDIVVTGADGQPLQGGTLYIESANGNNFSFSAKDNGFANGVRTFEVMPEGPYRVWIDPDDDLSQPYIGTQTITAQTGGNVWDIDLPAASPFTYSTPATLPSGSLVVGTTRTVLKGKTSLDNPPNPARPVTYTYIWLRDGAPIYGAQGPDASSYTLSGRDVGHQVSVIVRADTFGYPSVFTVLEVGSPTPAPAPTVWSAPSISAPASVVPGATLTARPGVWNTMGLGYGYQWRTSSDGSTWTDIPGATQRTYKLAVTDANKRVSVVVTTIKPGYATASAASTTSVAVGTLAAPKPLAAPKVTATGLPAPEYEYRVAAPATWTLPVTSVEYQWIVNGTATNEVPSSTATSFRCQQLICPTTAAIQLRIVAHKTGYADVERTVLIRKGTAPVLDDSPGFVVDTTAGGAAQGAGIPAQIGHVLTVTAPALVYPEGNGGTVVRSYQWLRNGVAITGATKTRYVPTTADLNRNITVKVTTSSTLYRTEVRTYAAGVGKYRTELALGSTVGAQIWGTDDLGTVKRAVLSGSWGASSVTTSYQWYICSLAECESDTAATGWKPISKAVGATYIPPATLASGQWFLVQVTGSRSGFQPYVTRSNPVRFTSDHPDATTLLPDAKATITGFIGGKAVIGKPLVAKPAPLDRTTGITHEYVWQVCEGLSDDCENVPGTAGKLSVTPDASWLGLATTPSVRFHDQVVLHGTPELDPSSSPVPLVLGTNVASRSASVTPVLAGGTTTFTVDPGGWSGSSYSYQWHDGTTPVGTNSATYQTTSTGTAIWVLVTVTRPGYSTVELRVVGRKGTFPAQNPALSGARYGDALQLATPVTLPLTSPSPSVTYQWYLGSTAIKGQTKPTFVPSTAYIGKSVRLRVTVASPYYPTTAYHTNPVVVGSHLPATGTPVMLAPAAGFAPGSTIKPSLAGVTAGLAYAYRWQRSTNSGASWVDVSSATTYVVAAADAGVLLRLRVTATRAGWTTAVLYSAAQSVDYAFGLEPTAPLALAGSGRVGTAVSIAPVWNTTGVTTKVEWMRNGVFIPGAVGASIVPTASWAGDELQAVVTASKPGHRTVVLMSDVLRIGDGTAPVATTSPTIAKSGTVLTASPGVWSVAGVTVTFRWYSQSAPGTTLGTAATLNTALHPGVTTFVVAVTAAREGYAPTTILKALTLAP